jgi:periplasmic copper chaperone A
MKKEKNVKKLLEGLGLLFISAVAAQATPVSISDAWFRFLPAGLPAGGYFVAHNSGASDLAITGAKSSACDMLMLHKSSNTGGMSGMDMVDKVPLPAHGAASFLPGGYHLMCDQPKMKVGAAAPVTLQLSDGSSVKVFFAVRDARGK